MCRRSSPEEERVDLTRLAEMGQIDRESIEIGVDQVVPPGNQREIAVAAPMRAKRHMQIGRPRFGPRRGHIQIVFAATVACVPRRCSPYLSRGFSPPQTDAMKYALIIPDGAADERQESLGGQTPLEAAQTPHMDALAREGLIGQADHVPASMPSGSDVGTMSLFGYDPLKYHTGRAPIEAAAQGIELGPLDWAIRCNLVHVADGRMRSFTAGQIPSDLARELIQLLQKDQCGSPTWKFHPGVSYRNLLIYRSRGEQAPFSGDTKTVPPHDIPDQPIEPNLPQGPGAGELRGLMERSRPLLAADSATTKSAQAAANCPATQTWLWGLGKTPALEPFRQRFGKTGAVITAVDLLRGLARLLGWQVIDVPGSDGLSRHRLRGQGALRDRNAEKRGPRRRARGSQ